MKHTVFIPFSERFEYARMFTNRGYDITDDLDEADLIQFTGGEDVSPYLYGQKVHPYTRSNHHRDKEEIKLFNAAQERGILCAGICRGGQFLNVMNEGSMWQNVNNHGTPHTAKVTGTGATLKVSSTHHQMMIPGKDGIFLLTASESITRERMGENQTLRSVNKSKFSDDIEAVYYPNTSSLCFQPHPEYPGFKDCTDLYFTFINQYLFGEQTAEKLVVKNVDGTTVVM